MLIPVQFIDQFRNGRLSFGIGIMLMNALLVGLFYRDHGIAGEILKFRQHFLRHFPDAVFDKPGIFMRGEYHRSFIPSLEEFIDPRAHRVFQNEDDLFKIDVLVIIRFNAKEPFSALVMGCHGDSREELVDLVLIDIEILQDPVGALFHNILGTGAGSHACHFSPDTFPDDRVTEGPSRNRTRMYLDNFMACSVAHRRLPLHHEFTAHKHLGSVRIFMTIKKFTCDYAAEFLDLIDIPVYCLLENLVNYLKIPGKVCAFEAAGQVDVHIEIGDKNHRAFLVPVNLDQFLYVLDPYPGQVDTDIRR